MLATALPTLRMEKTATSVAESAAQARAKMTAAPLVRATTTRPVTAIAPDAPIRSPGSGARRTRCRPRGSCRPRPARHFRELAPEAPWRRPFKRPAVTSTSTQKYLPRPAPRRGARPVRYPTSMSACEASAIRWA